MSDAKPIFIGTMEDYEKGKVDHLWDWDVGPLNYISSTGQLCRYPRSEDHDSTHKKGPS